MVTDPKTTARRTTRKRSTAKRSSQKTVRRRKPEPKAGKIGRPSLLDDATREAIAGSIRVGNYFQVACEVNGVSRRTGHSWMERGRREVARIDAMASEGVAVDPLPDEVPYLHFLHAIYEAEATAENVAVATQRDLMRPNYPPEVRLRAANSYLERKHPDRWSRAERREVSIDAVGTSTVTVRVEETQRERETAILAALLPTGVLDIGPAKALESGPTGDGGGTVRKRPRAKRSAAKR